MHFKNKPLHFQFFPGNCLTYLLDDKDGWTVEETYLFLVSLQVNNKKTMIGTRGGVKNNFSFMF